MDLKSKRWLAEHPPLSNKYSQQNSIKKSINSQQHFTIFHFPPQKKMENPLSTFPNRTELKKKFIINCVSEANKP